MKPKERLCAGGWSFAALLVAAGVGGCAYSGKGPIDEHYAKYKAGMPEGDKVFVCSSYGCRKQTPFKFTAADIAEVKKIMSAKRTATPAGEREATKDALAWMGRRADTAVGTAGDRPGDDMAGNGDPGQMDCVDVATNLSSYALVMERHKLFRHHTVGSMYVKEDSGAAGPAGPTTPVSWWRPRAGSDSPSTAGSWPAASRRRSSRSRDGTSTTPTSCSAARTPRARSTTAPPRNANTRSCSCDGGRARCPRSPPSRRSRSDRRARLRSLSARAAAPRRPGDGDLAGNGILDLPARRHAAQDVGRDVPNAEAGWWRPGNPELAHSPAQSMPARRNERRHLTRRKPPG